MEDIVYTMNHLKKMKLSHKASNESPMNHGGKVIKFLLRRKSKLVSVKKSELTEEE
jgi:hypothetical protein